MWMICCNVIISTTKTKMIEKTNGLIRSFAADQAPCNCDGMPYKQTGLMAISVKWKLSGKNPSGKVRFQCVRCKTRWNKVGVSWNGGDPS